MGSPGNAVLALARYWLDNAALIAGVEETLADRCHRVRYEDLVEDPEGVMAQVYAFIGVGPASGVAQACFSDDRERFGPADHKIWATSAVTGNSVGRGESVPAALIMPQVTTAINELTSKLGYMPVDGDWGSPGRSADPRVPDTIKGVTSSRGQPPDDRPAAEDGQLQQSLQSSLDGVGDHFDSRWDPVAKEKFLVVSRAARGGSTRHGQARPERDEPSSHADFPAALIPPLLLPQASDLLRQLDYPPLPATPATTFRYGPR